MKKENVETLGGGGVSARIVLIDDDKSTLKILRQQLKPYEVLAFSDAGSALADLEKLQPDLIVTDINLGGLYLEKTTQRVILQILIGGLTWP